MPGIAISARDGNLEVMKKCGWCPDFLTALFRLSIVPALLLQNPSTAWAQLGPIFHRSLEARILEADHVFRGTIKTVSRNVRLKPGEQKAKGARSSEGEVDCVFSVSVDETLKGDPGELVELTLQTPTTDQRIDHWQAAGTSFLWFRKLDQPNSPDWESIRLGKPVPANAHYRTDAPPLYSMDYSVLREPEEILSAAREFVQTYPEAGPNHLLGIASVADGIRGSGEGNFLFVPVTPTLEKLAKRLIHSPEEFVPEDAALESYSFSALRKGGVSALQYFESEENTAMLKALLVDPTSHGFHNRPGVKAFPIRKIAYEILQGWGVDCPKPVLMEKDGVEIDEVTGKRE